MFRRRLDRKISLAPKFRKIKFKEITGNQFQGTFLTQCELKKTIKNANNYLGFRENRILRRNFLKKLYLASNSATFFSLFPLYWKLIFLTYYDLRWPRNYFFLTFSESFILIYNFPTFNELLRRSWANLECKCFLKMKLNFVEFGKVVFAVREKWYSKTIFIFLRFRKIITFMISVCLVFV